MLKTRKGEGGYLHKLMQFLNLDATVYLSIGAKLWSLLKTPLTVIFITKYLTPEFQGYWYTFLSMAALSVFAEMGFTTIIVQYVSHDFAHLDVNEDDTVYGDPVKLEKFLGLIRFCIKRYMIIIPLGVLIVLTVGYIFFKDTLYSPKLLVVWVLYAVSGGLTLFTSLISSVLQGINKVKQILQISLYANITSTLALWIALLAGGSIWALTISSLMLCITSFLFFYGKFRRFFYQVLTYKITNKFNWGKEVYALQMRYSISWIAGYFIFNFVTPVTLYYLGPVMAGKVGITFTSTSAILQMAHSWVSNKIPELNMKISLNKKDEAKALFRSLNKSSVTFFFLCAIIVIAVLQLNLFDLQIKFLPVWLTAIVLLSELAKLLFGNWAVYLRAYKEEPYLSLSVLNGALTLLTFLICLRYYHSFNAALIIFTVLQLIILVPGIKKYNKK